MDNPLLYYLLCLLNNSLIVLIIVNDKIFERKNHKHKKEWTINFLN
ncbi:hypothetical protein GAPWKB11_0661 [Gilliamella apicola]|nr:hypothetical protein GAPWKB11_0661 [Gilliamella apicola]